jgi:membrane protein DedA with SNARE-associated domain
LFRPEYVERTRAFFEKYGPPAIVLGRFVPVVRTVITVMAGAGRMNYRTYTLYTVLGGILWATSVTLLGYWLGTSTSSPTTSSCCCSRRCRLGRAHRLPAPAPPAALVDHVW